MADRKQCPFCFAYVQLRADGLLREHRLTGGRLCNGSNRTHEDAKQAKRSGEAAAVPQSSRPDETSDASETLIDGLPF